MRSRTARRHLPRGGRRTAAAAVLVAVFHALMPVLGHTGLSLLPPQDRSDGVEAMAHQGHAPSDRPQPTQPQPTKHEPCPVCVVKHTVSVALPPPPVVVRIVRASTLAAAPHRAEQPAMRLVRLRPQPRAPPLPRLIPS